MKHFYCIPNNKCEKRRYTVNYQLNQAPICLVHGWLNSGAPALTIRHHLLKVRIFMEHHRNIVFIYKR